VLAPPDDAAALALALRDTALDNSGAAWGVSHFPGYDPGLSGRLRAFWRGATAGAAGRRVLDLLGVDLVLLPAGMPALPATTPVAFTRGHESVLLRNDTRRPTAFVATRWVAVPELDGARSAMLGVAADPDEIRVQVASGGASGGAITPCATASERPERVTLRCRSDGPGWAVLLDAWELGWTARVDGREARIELADALVRAVAVDPGEHTVVMVYRTPGLRPGAAIAACAWLLALTAAVRSRRRRSPPAVPAAPGAPRPGRRSNAAPRDADAGVRTARQVVSEAHPRVREATATMAGCASSKESARLRRRGATHRI
jgi:hypothetical protein